MYIYHSTGFLLSLFCVPFDCYGMIGGCTGHSPDSFPIKYRVSVPIMPGAYPEQSNPAPVQQTINSAKKTYLTIKIPDELFPHPLYEITYTSIKNDSSSQIPANHYNL